jgi:hypothetical protein
MKITTRQFIHSEHPVTCRNCQNHFAGKICNKCGEKVFDEKQLSSKHFFHQIIDFFTHFESKVLKTIWLNIIKPGFITQQNLEGIRVKYANPIQLYLVVSILFYFTVTKIGVTDYTPSYGDQQFYGLSAYKIFKWAKPADSMVLSGIDKMQSAYFYKTRNHMLERFETVKDPVTGLYPIRNNTTADTTFVKKQQLDAIVSNETEKLFFKSFDATVSTLSKTFIFVTLPFMAGFLFLFFFRRFKYYGAALILATHFMVFNLCFFMIHCVLDWLPSRIWGHSYGNFLAKPFIWLSEESRFTKFFEFLSLGSFEFFHLAFWVPWLFIAFKRLFNKPWWVNLLVSFVCGRIFYFLIFGFLKKLLIAFTVWSLH